jgi:hypothetical protein
MHGARPTANSPRSRRLAQDKNPHSGKKPAARLFTKRGKHLSQPQASITNPLSASEPWNLVADGYAGTN